jgi:hypothetical protein
MAVKGLIDMHNVLQFVIEGVVGKSYKGDIAIDDVSVNDGTCPPTGKYIFIILQLFYLLIFLDNIQKV